MLDGPSLRYPAEEVAREIGPYSIPDLVVRLRLLPTFCAKYKFLEFGVLDTDIKLP